MQVEPWYEGMPDPNGHSVRGREEYQLDWGGKLIFLNCIVGGAIDQRFRDAPNILVDLGSAASTDMTYTAAADIYLGDVSSQVYEFLYRPRPCLFLDAHATRWAGDANYAHWQAGEVVTDTQGLGAALDRAVAQHDLYRPVQRALFQRSFELTAERSAVRAARAVMSVLGDMTPMPALIREHDDMGDAEGLRVA